MSIVFIFELNLLLLEHKKGIKRFEWEKKCANTIQWAAFYGDVIHHIEEVTTGHRITISYKLYKTPIVHHATVDKEKLNKTKIEKEIRDVTITEWAGFGCEHM